MTRWHIHHGDNRQILPTIPDASIDAIVTDPPYELGFMGKTWDASGIAYDVNMWRECLRVLKPGGHILAFGGSRTYHRLACAIEDAGFEIRDQIMWVYGSGFPKSLDVSKAIDKAAGVERPVVGFSKGVTVSTDDNQHGGINRGAVGIKQTPIDVPITAPATDAAKRWEGWGTALKPAHEPIVLARKPLIGTVANNVLQHGTGALNIDGCRVDFVSEEDRDESTAKNRHQDFGTEPMTNNTVYGDYSMMKPTNYNPPGRWPANLIHDGSDEVLQLFPEGSYNPKGVFGRQRGDQPTDTPASFAVRKDGDGVFGYGDSGSAARFFYCAKANKRDRNEGLDDFQPRIINEITPPGTKGSQSPRAGAGRNGATLNHHPTVKPTELMRYLCRLITPPGGTILDPFTGSGSTGKAAILEGFRFVGIEQDPDYVTIAQARIRHAEEQ